MTFSATTSPALAGSVTVTAQGMTPCTSVVTAGAATCTATLPAGAYPSFLVTFTPTDPGYGPSTVTGSAFTVTS